MSTHSTLARAQAERLRRMQECWRTDQLTVEETVSAMRRWAWRRRPTERRSAPHAWLLVLAGSLLAAGALGGVSVLKSPAPAVPSSVSVSASATESVRSRPKPVWEWKGRRIEALEDERLPLGPGERVTLVVGESRTELVGPGVAEIRRSNQSDTYVARFSAEPSARSASSLSFAAVPTTALAAPQNSFPMGTAAAPSAVAPARHPSLSPTETVRRSGGLAKGEKWAAHPAKPVEEQIRSLGAWSRAAEALRQGDESRASEALGELGQSPDALTRDAALLAQAQLDVAAGRRERALPILRALAGSGSTALVRRRASELLQEK